MNYKWKTKENIAVTIIITIIMLLCCNYSVKAEGEETVEIKFDDINMYNAIVEELKDKIASKDDNTKTINMTQENINGVTKIIVGDKNITSIAGIEKFKNLVLLWLTNNNISDISVISNFSKLNILTLEQNNISNIEPLANLIQLTSLDVSSNNITDISALSKLTNLTSLSLGNNNLSKHRNNISDISALANLKKLSLLQIDENNIKNLEILNNLSELEILSLRKTNINNISFISNLNKLEILDIDENNISNINILSNLTNLIELDISDNNINDITPLAKLTNLTELDMGGNNISNISAVEKLTKLTKLNAVGNKIKDIQPIENLNNLNEITIYTQKIQTNTTERTVNLPTIFIQSQDKNSKGYTDKKMILKNCKLSEDKKSVILDEGTKEASVKIDGGLLRYSTFTINRDISSNKEEISKANTQNQGSEEKINSGSKDDTIAKGKLPQTGTTSILFLLGVIILIIQAILYVKYRKLKI